MKIKDYTEVLKKRRYAFTLSLLTILLLLWLQLSEISFIKEWRNSLERLGFESHTIVNRIPWDKSKSDTLIVDIDEKSLESLGPWPWDRSLMLRLVNKLVNNGISILAFDLVFETESHNSAREVLDYYQKLNQIDSTVVELLKNMISPFDHDAVFANRLRQQETVLGFRYHDRPVGSKGVLPESLPIEQQINPRAFLTIRNFTGNIRRIGKASRFGGFINLDPGAHATLYKAPLVMRYKHEIYPSLALQIARLRLLSEKITLHSSTDNSESLSHIQIEETRIPVGPHGEVLLTFRGPPGSFPAVSAADIINNKIEPTLLENKTIILSSSVRHIRPRVRTNNGTYTTAELHANILNGILNSQFLSRPSQVKTIDTLLILLTGLLLCLLFPVLTVPRMLALASVCIAAWLLYALTMYHTRLTLVAISIPLLLVASLTLIHLLDRLEPGKSALTSLGQLLLAPARSRAGRRKTETLPGTVQTRLATVMFIDIKDFQRLSTSLDSADLNRLLKLIGNPLTTAIEKHQGQPGQYVGHMIMASWAGQTDGHDATNPAINAALEIERLRDCIENILIKNNLPGVDFCIGINTGEISTRTLFHQTLVFGDAVQTASKLTSLAAFYGVHCVIGEETYKLSNGIVCRKLDNIQPKNNSQYISIYQPVCDRHELDLIDYYELKQYNQAMNLFEHSEFSSALELFQTLHEHRPDNQLYKRFIKQIETITQQGIQKNWRGMLNRRSL